MACGAAGAYRALPYPSRARPYRRGRGNLRACVRRPSAACVLWFRRAWALRPSVALCEFLLSVLRRDGFRLLLPWQFLLNTYTN